MRNYWSITGRCCLILGVTSALIWLGISSPFKTEANAALLIPSGTQYQDALRRAKLGPEQLTAAGLSSTDIQNSLGDVWDTLLASENALEIADAAFADAEAVFRPLEDLVRTAQATPEEFAQYQTARAAFNTAQNQREAVLDDIFNAGITDLNVTQQQSLTRQRQSSDWRMPWEFHVVDRSEANWVQLREALAAERYAFRNDQPIDQDSSATLAGERSDSAVALARTNLDANLAVNTANWDQIIDGQ